jgi:hypothetical protein
MAESFLLVWFDAWDDRVLTLARHLEAWGEVEEDPAAPDPPYDAAANETHDGRCSARQGRARVALAGHTRVSFGIGNQSGRCGVEGPCWLHPRRAAAALRAAWLGGEAVAGCKATGAWTALEVAAAASHCADLLQQAPARADQESATFDSSAAPSVLLRGPTARTSVELLCVVNTSLLGTGAGAFGRSPRDPVTGLAVYSMLRATSSTHTAAGGSVRFWDVAAAASPPASLSPGPALDAGTGLHAVAAAAEAGKAAAAAAAAPRLSGPCATWAALSGAALWARRDVPPPLLLGLGGCRPVELRLRLPAANTGAEGAASEGTAAAAGSAPKRLLDPRGAAAVRWQGALRMGHELWGAGSTCSAGSAAATPDVFIEVSSVHELASPWVLQVYLQEPAW